MYVSTENCGEHLFDHFSVLNFCKPIKVIYIGASRVHVSPFIYTTIMLTLILDNLVGKAVY